MASSVSQRKPTSGASCEMPSYRAYLRSSATSTVAMPQTRSSKYCQVQSARHSGATTVARPRRRCSSCWSASLKRSRCNNCAKRGACSKVTGVLRPCSTSSHSRPAESEATKRRLSKTLRNVSSSMPRGPKELSCRTLSAAARSKLARSSRPSSSPRRPFQTTCERQRGNTSPRRRHTPIIWPKKWSMRRPGEPAETSSAGFSMKTSRCSPASASWFGLGSNTGSCGDMSSSATVSRKSRYTPPES
mmetsp:Transcript_110328/g.307395  ORF Transcript_110328/g.307395 Transcript_110328/m.307395 type:complete len:246 (+) Transcript_110328:471-1208(+)